MKWKIPNVSSNVSSINLLEDFRNWERATNSSSSSMLETNPINHTEEPMGFTKRTILTPKRKWKTIPRSPGFSGWLEHVYKGSNKVRFEYCETSQKALTYIRQRGMATDLMSHVLLPKGWNEIIYHKWMFFQSKMYLRPWTCCMRKTIKRKKADSVLLSTQSIGTR